MAFFRIVDSNMAAERVKSFEELHDQLNFILKGRDPVDPGVVGHPGHPRIARYLRPTVYRGRRWNSLKEWGVQNVKSIELIDIHDSAASQANANIMAIRQSAIQQESRVKIASSMQTAAIA